MRNSNYLTTNLVNFRSTINKQRRISLGYPDYILQS